MTEKKSHRVEIDLPDEDAAALKVARLLAENMIGMIVVKDEFGETIQRYRQISGYALDKLTTDRIKGLVADLQRAPMRPIAG